MVGYSRSPIRAPVLSLVVLPGVTTVLLLIVLALSLSLGFAAFLLALVVRVLVAAGLTVVGASTDAALMLPFAPLVVALAGLEPVTFVVPGSAGVVLVV